MELFKLFGTIAVKNTEANSAIDTTTDKAQSASGKLSQAFQNAGTKISGVGSTITKGMAVVGTAVGAGATAVFKFAEKSASAADTVDKMSQKIGISREAYQELDFICSQSGTSVDTLQMGIKTLTNQMQSAADGTSSAVGMFDKLGVSIYDNNDQLKNQETMMWEAMNALQNMKNQTEKAALANDLFGRSGSELMPLLNGASGSIDNMRQQAHDLGLVMSNDAVDSGVKLTDTIDQAKRAFTAIAISVGAEFMPMIQQVAQYIVDHIPQIKEKIGIVIQIIKDIGSGVQETIDWFSGLDEGTQKTIVKFGLLIAASGPVLSLFGKTVSGIGNIIKVGGSLIGGIGKLSPAISGVMGIGSKLIGGIGGLIGKVTGGGGLIAALGAIPAPVWIVIGIFAALVAAGVLIYKNWDEIKEWAGKAWGKITEIVGGAVDGIRNFFSKIIDFVKNNWQGLALLLVNPFVGGFKLLYDNCESFRNFVDNFLGNLKEGFQNFVSNISEKAGELKDKVVNKAKELKDGAIEKFQELKEKAAEKIENLRENASNKFNQLKESATEKVNGLKENAVSKFQELRDKASEKINSLKEKGMVGFEALRSGALEKFDNLKSGATEKLDAVKNFVSNTVQKLKDFFKFDWSLPKIKLPHFSMEGSFSLNPPSIPHIGVEWYKKAMDNPLVMDKPTAFGINASGQIMAGGEAGSEVVSGTQTLMNMISATVAENNNQLYEVMNKLYNLLVEYLPALANMQMVLDSGALVGELAQPMNEELGRITHMRGRRN